MTLGKVQRHTNRGWQARDGSWGKANFAGSPETPNAGGLGCPFKCSLVPSWQSARTVMMIVVMAVSSSQSLCRRQELRELRGCHGKREDPAARTPKRRELGALEPPRLGPDSLLLPVFVCPQVMKTYHMYHAESISAESKLKEAEKQEEKQFNKAGELSMNLLRHEDRPQRRSSVKKIEKMKEKASAGPGQEGRACCLTWGPPSLHPGGCQGRRMLQNLLSWRSMSWRRQAWPRARVSRQGRVLS